MIQVEMVKMLFSCRKINAHLFSNGLESMYPMAWFSLKLGMWEDKLTLHASIIIHSKIREAHDTRGNIV